MQSLLATRKEQSERNISDKGDLMATKESTGLKCHTYGKSNDKTGAGVAKDNLRGCD